MISGSLYDEDGREYFCQIEESTPPPDPPPDPPPSTQRMITAADLVLDYQWHPGAHYPDPSNHNRWMAYSNATHCIHPDGSVTVLTHTHDTYGWMRWSPRDGEGLCVDYGELPTPTNAVSKSGIGIWGLIDQVPDPDTRVKDYIRGWRNVGHGGLRWTQRPIYPADGLSIPWLGGYQDELIAPTGPDIDGIANPYHMSKMAGYMCHDPGGSVCCGLSGMSILGPGSSGPSLYRIADGTAEPLIVYDSRDHKSEHWNEITRIRGCAWIDTPSLRGILFSVMQGNGVIWYGKPGSGPGDPGTDSRGEVVRDETGELVWDSLQKNATQWSYRCSGHRTQEIWFIDPDGLAGGPLGIEPAEIWTIQEGHQPVTLAYRGRTLSIGFANAHRLSQYSWGPEFWTYSIP